MTKQQFDVSDYWKVTIFYDVDYSHFALIARDLVVAGASPNLIQEMYDMLFHQGAKAATFNNINRHRSIVLFNEHCSREDYINSIVHEAEHVKQAMLEAYDVEDSGEPPAYTIGYLVSRMYEVFRQIIAHQPNC